MKLISLNIENNTHPETLIFLKKEKADIICLQEVLEEDFEIFKKELGLNGVYQPWNYWNSQIIHPHLFGKKQGLAIFAKNIINSESIFYIGKEENIIKSFNEYLSNKESQKNNILLWATVRDANGIIFKFATTQLPVTYKGEVTTTQLKIIDRMLYEIKYLNEFILCGNMNAPRGYESFIRISEKYKDNVPSEYKTSIDQNLHRVKGIQFMVDGLFTTPGYKASEVRLVDGISDHMAIIAEINKI